MPTIKFTTALKRFYPNLQALEIAGGTVAELVETINDIYPGIKDYIVDEQGRLRKHVNIFLGNELIKDRNQLKDIVKENDELLIFQALSGG